MLDTLRETTSESGTRRERRYVGHVLNWVSLPILIAAGEEQLHAGTTFRGARPMAEFFTTTFVGRGLAITSAYMGNADLDEIPVTHTIVDDELGNEYVLRTIALPGQADRGTTAYLLYDHLDYLRGAFFERRGVNLSVDVQEDAVRLLERSAAALPELQH